MKNKWEFKCSGMLTYGVNKVTFLIVFLDSENIFPKFRGLKKCV